MSAVDTAVKALVSRRLLEKAQRIGDLAKEELSQQGRGRLAMSGTRVHQASAPGDAPALDTGRLRASIKVEVVSELEIRVGSDVEYARFLELGTRDIAPRPFMRTALAKARSG